MSEKLGKTRYDFDFEPFETGLYVLKVKETDIVKVKEMDDDAIGKGPKNDFNYLVQFQAEGGEMDGRFHFERFPHIAQGHIGLQKLDACMIKLEVIKPPTDPDGHDTALFDTEDFRKRFRVTAIGRKLVAIVKRAERSEKRGGGTFSNIVSFYNINELPQAKLDFEKKYKKGGGSASAKPTPELPGSETLQPPIPPTSGDW